MKRLNRWFAFWVFVLTFVAYAPVQAAYTLDESSGTNAVTQLQGNVQNAGNTLIPVLLGLIFLMSVIGLYYRVARKAKIGT